MRWPITGRSSRRSAPTLGGVGLDALDVRETEPPRQVQPRSAKLTSLLRSNSEPCPQVKGVSRRSNAGNALWLTFDVTQYRRSTLANEANRREAKQSRILPPNVHILIDRAAGEDHYLDLIQCDGKCGGRNQQHNYHGGRKRSHQRATDSECRDNRYVGE